MDHFSDFFVVRKAVPEDAPKIYEVEKNSFDTPWSLDSITKDLRDNPRALYILLEDSAHNVWGYVSMWILDEEVHINNVAVMPQQRERGFGSFLMQGMLEATERMGARSHTLEVRADNEAAIGLYSKFGFREAGRRPGYYQEDGMDAVIMWRIGDPEKPEQEN